MAYSEWYCHERMCRQRAHYIVTNGLRSIDEQLKKKEIYCLKHAQALFRADCDFYAHNTITVYKVSKEFSREKEQMKHG